MDLRASPAILPTAQHAAEVIRPALERWIWVLSDRYSDATLAYQGFGRGLDLKVLRGIQTWATDGLAPDHTILVDCDMDLALRRMQKREDLDDRVGGAGLPSKVRRLSQLPDWSRNVFGCGRQQELMRSRRIFANASGNRSVNG
jgi:hypothetical protein